MNNNKSFQPYSALMSVYYKENPSFLQRSVVSVMEQSVPPDDFVIICDGELTDELYKQLDSLSSNYPEIKIIKNKENKGLGASLAQGIFLTKNEIIMRMDSDDICLKERAEKQLPLMSQYDLVGSFVSEFDGDENNYIGIRKVPEKQKEILKFSKKRCPFNHPSVMYKRQSVLDAGNYQTLLYVEDYFLWIRLLERGASVYNIQEVLVNMRSGIAMRSRRGGKIYKSSINKLRKYMLKHKMINVFQYCWIILVQNIFLSFGPYAKNLMYKLFLRKKYTKRT